MKHITTLCTIIGIAIYCDASAAQLELIWKTTDVANNRAWGASDYPSWQAVGYNGCVYIQNAKRQVVEVWNNTGKITEISSGKGTNITIDDANNLIVRASSYTKNCTSENDVIIIPLNGDESHKIKLGALSGEYGYLYGHVSGNMLNSNATMYCTAEWSTTINKIALINGVVQSADSRQYKFSSISNSRIDPATQRSKAMIQPNAIVSAYTFDGNTELAFGNPYYDLTGEKYGNANSIYSLSVDETGIINKGFYRTPGHNGLGGFDIFKINGTRYIAYPSGDNNCDGFSVAEIYSTTLSPNNNPGDYDFIVVSCDETTNSEGLPLYADIDNRISAISINAEPIPNSNAAYIYVYIPQCYAAMYKLDLDASGTTQPIKTENPNRLCFTTSGYISISCNRVCQIYNTMGQLLSETETGYSCQPGMYIVVSGSTAQKVIVY